MTDPSFVHLRLHSEYSVVDGIVRLDEAVEAAVADRMPALGLTDLGNVFGLVKFYTAARSRGVKPIAGCRGAGVFRVRTSEGRLERQRGMNFTPFKLQSLEGLTLIERAVDQGPFWSAVSLVTYNTMRVLTMRLDTRPASWRVKRASCSVVSTTVMPCFMK